MLREALEGVIPPALVTPVLFEALEPYGDLLPAGGSGLLEVVRGPLAEVVKRRIGPAAAASVVEHIEQIVRATMSTLEGSTSAPFEQPTPIVPIERHIHEREREATQQVPLARSAVAVLVVAAGQGFAQRLGAVLGEGVVAPFVLGAASSVRARLEGRGAPDVVLVDAGDFPPVEPDELAAALDAGPLTLVRVLWGADLPYGRGVAAAATARGIALVALDRAHGVDPLLDLVRSRRGR